jgi:hypothetical protein
MKKTFTLFILIGAVCFASKAQNTSFLSKVPSTSTVVIKYSGDNLSKNVPIKKLDSYDFVKNNLYKALKIDSLTSLEGTGINFEQDAYQYVTMDDSSINFTSLFALKNVQQFLQLIQSNYHAEMRPEKRNGFEFLGLSDDSYIGWNDKQAVLVYSSYQNKKSYYDYQYATADSTVVMVDTAVMVSPELAPPPPPPPAKPKVKKGMPGKKAPVKTARGKGKKPAPKKVYDEEVSIAPVEDNGYVYDTTGQAAREAWQLMQDKYVAAKQKKSADSVINAFFTGNAASIQSEGSYSKVIDPAANVSVWINYDDLMYQYWKYVFGGFRYSKSFFMSPRSFGKNENKGFRNGMNLYFEKDKMRLEQKMYSPDAQITALGKEVYNSKQSAALAGYVNPGNIAYMSASMNTEAMANYYYKLIRQYLNSSPLSSEYSDMVDVYLDLLEIIIDEKAIAELMPGNMLMVLHDMKTKMVTYTDYTYDDNFKATEVKKTKEEVSPNFTFVMETKKDAFMKKIANLPLKYAEKEKFNYKEKGGYYELAFEEGKYPISSLYFMVKDGKAFITTNKEVIDMALANKGYTIDDATKSSILNNNVSLRIDTKKLIQQINPQLTSDASKKVSQYLEENMSDVKMEGGLKDGMMQATTTMGISGNHTNSLEFFFNMIDAINNIMEKDKTGRQKKID